MDEPTQGERVPATQVGHIAVFPAAERTAADHAGMVAWLTEAAGIELAKAAHANGYELVGLPDHDLIDTLDGRPDYSPDTRWRIVSSWRVHDPMT